MSSRTSPRIARHAVLVLLVGFSGGCQSLRTPAPPPAGSAAPIQWWSAESEQPPSSFHVVAEGRDGDEGGSSSLRLCPVADAVFLCDPALRFDAGVFVDPGTAGVGQVIGRWPDWLWGTRPKLCGDQPDCQEGDLLLRWQDDDWVRAGLIPYRRSAGESYVLGQWSGRRLLALVSVVEEGRAQRVLVFGEPASVPAALYEGRLLFQAVPVGPGQVAVRGVEGKAGESAAFLERWENEQRIESAPVPEGSWRISLTSWTNIVALASGERRVVHFDGLQWRSVSLPDWGIRALDYVQDGRDEWVVMTGGTESNRGSTVESRLFLRSGGGAWSEVSLPPPEFARPGDDEKLQPTELHVAGSADIWIRAHYVANCADRGVILHNQPPREVCFVERNAQLCTGAPVPRSRQTCAADE